MKSSGTLLREARENLNLKQTEVASKLNINNKALSRYENDSNLPDPDTLKLLCKFYNVSADYILGLTSTKSINIKGEYIGDEEQKILDYFNRLNSENKDLIRGNMVQLFRDQEKEASTVKKEVG